jgi:hypothetical protein
MEPNLQKFLAYVENPDNQTNFKDRLRTAVSYKRFVVLQQLHANISVSSVDVLPPQVAMGIWLRDRLKDYGVDTELVDLQFLRNFLPLSLQAMVPF